MKTIKENGFARFFNERSNASRQILDNELLRQQFAQKVGFLKETMETVKSQLNNAYGCISRMERDEFSTDKMFGEDLRALTDSLETMQIYANSVKDLVGDVYDLAEDNELV